MRLVVPASLLCLALTTPAWAATPYLHATVGGSGATSDTVRPSGRVSGTQDSITTEVVPVGFGAGFTVQAAGGLEISRHVSVELGIGWFASLGAEWSDSLTDSNDPKKDVTATTTLSGSALVVVPSLVLRADGGHLRPHGRLGLVLAWCNLEGKESSDDGEDVSTNEYVFDGGVTPGAEVAMGAEWDIGDGLSLVGEIAGRHLTYEPDGLRLTVATQNGKDRLSDMTTREKEVVYTDKLTVTNDNPSEGKPKQVLQVGFPFSSLGASLGIRMRF